MIALPNRRRVNDQRGKLGRLLPDSGPHDHANRRDLFLYVLIDRSRDN